MLTDSANLSLSLSLSFPPLSLRITSYARIYWVVMIATTPHSPFPPFIMLFLLPLYGIEGAKKGGGEGVEEKCAITGRLIFFFSTCRCVLGQPDTHSDPPPSPPPPLPSLSIPPQKLLIMMMKRRKGRWKKKKN